MPAIPCGDLNALVVFAAVTEAGGITAAAGRLGIPKARVSVLLRRLESGLGVTLFTRTTRRVVPTEAGRRLYEDSKPALDDLGSALAQIGGDAGSMSGTLRIAAPVDYAAQVVAPAVGEFARRHPRLSIRLCASDRITDLVAEGIDVSFRMGWLRESSMRAVKLGEFEQCLVAAPDYLRARGHPGHPRELVDHDWIALTLLPTPLTWRFAHADGTAETVRLSSRLQTDSPATLRALVTSGAGLSILDHPSVSEALAGGRLVRLLPGWSVQKGGVHAVFPPGRLPPPGVRAFVEFFREHLAGPGHQR